MAREYLVANRNDVTAVHDYLEWLRETRLPSHLSKNPENSEALKTFFETRVSRIERFGVVIASMALKELYNEFGDRKGRIFLDKRRRERLVKRRYLLPDSLLQSNH